MFRPNQSLTETGIPFGVAQVNCSVSNKGVIRGIHFKKYPPGQAKFITVQHGSIIDVVVDLRKSSETFLQWRWFELSASNKKSLLIGYGIGHAFLSLEDETRVSYLCDSVFEPELEFAINPMSAGIDWQQFKMRIGTSQFLLSARDESAPRLGDPNMILFD